MRVVHLSDLHLGFGDAGRGSQGCEGHRGRAGDVARAFRDAVAQVAELRPHLMVIAGDVFDHPGVSASAIHVFCEGIAGLRTRLPDVAVAVAAGARDTFSDAERRGPLALAEALEHMEVASASVRRISVGNGRASVTLVPHRALTATDSLAVAPHPQAKWNVLVAYAAPADERSPAFPRSRPPLSLRASGWDYVALGSNHLRTRISDRVHYPGSLARVGSDPWENAAHDKGFLFARLDTGAVSFRPVETRPAISLAPVDGVESDAAKVAGKLAEALDGVPGGVDGALLSVPVTGLSESQLARVDRDVLGPVRKRVVELRIQVVRAPRPKASRQVSQAAPAVDGKLPGASASRIPHVFVLEQLGRALGVEGASGDSGLELADACGLAAWIGGGDTLWDGCWSALAHAESAVQPADHALERDELAALWFGAGAVDQWQATGARLIGGSRSMVEATKDRAGNEEERLRLLRELAVEAKGDLEAETVDWVRERQDAETRLLLYRDRGRELKARLAEIEDGGPNAPCASCGRPLGGRLEKVGAARREEWEDMVRDGRWWRRRRDQLEFKPASLRVAEARALRLAAEVEGRMPASSSVAADAPARRRYRALVHAQTIVLTGGRLAGAFPALYTEWAEGCRRDDSDVSALELAARIVLAELATGAGLSPGSMVVPAGLDRLTPDDLPRALVELRRLARRIPLVLVRATENVVHAAPELFDVVLRAEDADDGSRLRCDRPGPRAIRLQER